MPNPIKINLRQFMKSEHQNVGDVTIEVTTSPYDIPEAVEPSLSEDKKRFCLQFKYIGGDEPTNEQINNHVLLRIGKESGRLYALEIDLQGMIEAETQSTLLQKASNAVRAMRKAVSPRRTSQNYGIIEDLLARRGPDLVASVQ